MDTFLLFLPIFTHLFTSLSFGGGGLELYPLALLAMLVQSNATALCMAKHGRESGAKHCSAVPRRNLAGRSKFPSAPPKILQKMCPFLQYFFIQPQVWYIITLLRVSHQLLWSCISSRHSRAYSFLRLDEIQHCVLIICNFCEIGDIQRQAVDFRVTI